MEFKPKPAKRYFRRCQVCGSEWPTSVEYCRQCTVWLGTAHNTEDLLWYVPAGEFQVGRKQHLPDGIHEAAVLTIAACDSSYINRSKCPELLVKTTEQIMVSGGLMTKGPGGHLAACFAGGNFIETSTRAVYCALLVQAESRSYGIKTFMGINTGPVLVRTQTTREPDRTRKGVYGEIIRLSEALAFSLYPQMIVLSPATFKVVAARFECYGTEPVNLWGMYPNTPATVYIVAGPKKVTSWKNRLNSNPSPLVGRKKELALLLRCWEDVRSGKMPAGLMIHLTGEPGTGKSKLLQAFLAKVSKTGEQTVLVKLAGANYGGRSGLLLEEFVSECYKEGVPSANIVRNPIPESFPTRVRLISRLIGELKGRCPSLILIDDVHWADRASIKIFGKVFTSLPANMMVIASYRPSGSELAKMLTNASAIQIILGPLDEDEAKQISKMQSRKGRWIAGSTWDDIWEKSRGNPLYVEEATKLLLARRKSSLRKTSPDTASVTRTLPGTLSGLLTTRIREWADRELNELRQEMGLQWGRQVHSRLADLETQVNDWLDRLETQGYLERAKLAECMEELEHFQNKVIELCLAGGLSRFLTTRLGESLSRLYVGSYEDHYRYLRQHSKSGENRPQIGNQALRVAERALQSGKLHEALRFFRIADEILPKDHPLRRDLVEKAGDANLMLGRASDAARLFQKRLAEGYSNSPLERTITHKLLTALILKGEAVDPGVCRCGEDPCPWHLVLMGLHALFLKENKKSLLFAEKAKQVSLDWSIYSSACLIGALAVLIIGKRKDASIFCMQAAEAMESGGLSLLSFGLHWLLSLTEEGLMRKRHKSIPRLIARQLGITSGLRALESRFYSLSAYERQNKRAQQH